MPENQLILVVDDDPRIIQLVSTFLDISGFRVTTAMDADAARGVLEAGLPDAMILDIMLPDIDGISFCKEIREHAGWDKIPIIMFSAKSDSGDIRRAMEAGATKYISKPASLKEIMSTLRETLDMPPEPLQSFLPDEHLSGEDPA